ncbi:gly-6, partial [Symbiodinium microadriaticum]
MHPSGPRHTQCWAQNRKFESKSPGPLDFAGTLQGHAPLAGPQAPFAPVSQLRGASAAPALQPGRISVVLPCLNESEFAVKTVQSFCNRTPSELLAEIIVVDDGSWPPLEVELRHRVDAACRLR